MSRNGQKFQYLKRAYLPINKIIPFYIAKNEIWHIFLNKTICQEGKFKFVKCQFGGGLKLIPTILMETFLFQIFCK